MRIKELTLRDKKTIDRYLRIKPHRLAVYCFENIYIWKKLYRISWTLINDNVCVFFQDKFGVFLYLEPLGRDCCADTIARVFKFMDERNKNKSLSRIENVEESSLASYRGRGWRIIDKGCDYIYTQEDMSMLAGDKFKSKRANYNYFIKHYACTHAEFQVKYSQACLELYDRWSARRKATSQDTVYTGMLDDSRITLNTMLKYYAKLKARGMVVFADGKMVGFTLGSELDAQNFCIIYEVVDIGYKGASQYIFREFCRQLKDYEYINVMDDSGLGNLRKVKLSYHPVQQVPAFIVAHA